MKVFISECVLLLLPLAVWAAPRPDELIPQSQLPEGVQPLMLNSFDDPVDTMRVFEPQTCADLSATPTPLPNGDMQFPMIPCKQADYKQPLGEPAQAEPEVPVVPRPVVKPEQPLPTLDELEQGGAPEANDSVNYNNLQMMRLGELDARQGRPLNMSHADDLFYMKGYTKGQDQRLNSRQPGGFGGVSGFGR